MTWGAWYALGAGGTALVMWRDVRRGLRAPSVVVALLVIGLWPLSWAIVFWPWPLSSDDEDET